MQENIVKFKSQAILEEKYDIKRLHDQERLLEEFLRNDASKSLDKKLNRIKTHNKDLYLNSKNNESRLEKLKRNSKIFQDQICLENTESTYIPATYRKQTSPQKNKKNFDGGETNVNSLFKKREEYLGNKPSVQTSQDIHNNSVDGKYKRVGGGYNYTAPLPKRSGSPNKEIILDIDEGVLQLENLTVDDYYDNKQIKKIVGKFEKSVFKETPLFVRATKKSPKQFKTRDDPKSDEFDSLNNNLKGDSKNKGNFDKNSSTMEPRRFTSRTKKNKMKKNCVLNEKYKKALEQALRLEGERDLRLKNSKSKIKYKNHFPKLEKNNNKQIFQINEEDFEQPQELDMEHEILEIKEQILNDVRNLANHDIMSISVIDSNSGDEEILSNENTESEQDQNIKNLNIDNQDEITNDVCLPLGNIFPVGHEGLTKLEPLEQQLINEFEQRKYNASPSKYASPNKRSNRSEDYSENRSRNSSKKKQYKSNDESPNIRDFLKKHQKYIL